MRDELGKADRNECTVINIDESRNEGTHWTCLYIKNSVSFYFDSYGFPPSEEVQKYCSEPRFYSSFQIQKDNEGICGHYCVYVLHKLGNGCQFADILDELYRYNYG